MFTVLSVSVAVFLCGGGNCAPAFAAGPAAAASPGPVVKCLEDPGDARSAGGAVVLAACDASPAQHWTWAGSTLRINGLCLSSVDAMATLEPCGRAGEQWADKGTQLISVQSGQCLTDPGGSIANGTALDLEPCNGSAGQRLALPVPSSSAALTWVFIALIALLLIGLVFLLSLASSQRRIGRMFATVRSWFPRRKRRLAPAVAALLADAATSRDAMFAVNHAGRGVTWWPYAAAVSADDVSVWLAGVDVPAPVAPWRAVPGDSRTWTASRSDVSGARAASDAQSADPEICPVVLGILDEAVVVVDVSQAHGMLVVEGDERLAQQVRASADAQLEGGEVVVRGEGPHPAEGRTHWTIHVDAEGWISIHGRRMQFADTPGLEVLGSVLDEQLPLAADDQLPAADEPDIPVLVEQSEPAVLVGTAEDHVVPKPRKVVPSAAEPKALPAEDPQRQPEPKPEPESESESDFSIAVPAVSAAPVAAAAPARTAAAPAPIGDKTDAADEIDEDEDEDDEESFVDLRSIAVSSAQVPVTPGGTGPAESEPSPSAGAGI